MELQRLLSAWPKTSLWNGYVHNLASDQDGIIEYRNFCRQRLSVHGLFLNSDGTELSGVPPLTAQLNPNEFLQISTKKYLGDRGIHSFQGQCMLFFENPADDRDYVPPAVTMNWVSESHHSEVASQAVRNLNSAVKKGGRSFFMYCPMALVNDDYKTLVTIFNSSVDSSYNDAVLLRPVLRRLDGKSLEGEPVRIPPFGMALIDVGTFGNGEGERFLRADGGRGSLSISHSGYSLTSFFFLVHKKTNRVITGQHTQPPGYVFSEPKVWWGKLRRYAFWS